MPRNGQGVYSLPPVYEAVTGETIEAQQHNVPLEDIAADLNAARSVATGGTGGQSATQARENLDVYSKAESIQAIGDIAAKETPVDADSVVIVDSADGNKPKKTLWTKIKALINTGSVGAAIAAANGKATPADGDFFSGVEAGGSTMFKSTWGNIKTALAAIHYSKTEVNNIVAGNMAGRAYPRRQDGSALNFIGGDVTPGQPPALIGGGWDGNFNNFYYYSTTTLNVGYASQAGYAANAERVGGYAWADILNQLNWRVTDTRFSGFIQASIPIPVSGGIPNNVMEANGYVHTSTWGAAGSDRNLYFGMRQPQIFIPNVGWRALGGW
ncbi:hypothetical protein [Ochrobactrum sp. A-1]|uniref:hypothetical protein n=1 Tax=Ochrobactrum sp. A-1 TaxID=2920940 RepID=UPI001F0AA355|nr:hypothetical protein [Ochrobactrum sp. A-1]